MASEGKLRIVMIDGGLAGATLMNALLKHSHLSPEMFKSAPEFSERGAAVGIAQNGQAALDELGPEIAGSLDRAGAVVMTSKSDSDGPQAGELVFNLPGEQRGKVAHRKELLDKLPAPRPKSHMHSNKRVTNIEPVSGNSAYGSLKIHFQDGSVHEADAVIGADGVHGYVHTHILGPSHPALKSKFSDQRQYGWIGSGGFFMHDVLDGGKTLQCVTCAQTDEGHAVVMGDAAHAMTPWQGSGAGQAIEDALVLDVLLREVKDARQLDTAFKAYDQVRHPRTQRIITSNYEVGMVLCDRAAAGLEVEKISTDLLPRWIFIHSQD
ncbi:FAD/NAD(P)-binding domain-containing protein [Lentithecium fluviatile CBS 122367]|uniref:FAD/NAD(P)-binding domain-containing protein n=1 Tax=Lentithecium fluviatile CBS 122367 TaxID=1168545 RepID=A0A6G1IZK7_9PLEO|nr:FAD/NAD(P)-binding domain-containing protein [Lentithecium fluviatile CBS 122367]